MRPNLRSIWRVGALWCKYFFAIYFTVFLKNCIDGNIISWYTYSVSISPKGSKRRKIPYKARYYV